MNQYFKRQLKTPTCFGSFGIHLQGVLKVLNWNYLWCFVCVFGVWQREICTCGVCVCRHTHHRYKFHAAKHRLCTQNITSNFSQALL